MGEHTSPGLAATTCFLKGRELGRQGIRRRDSVEGDDDDRHDNYHRGQSSNSCEDKFSV
jgi:hypothetical protein